MAPAEPLFYDCHGTYQSHTMTDISDLAAFLRLRRKIYRSLGRVQAERHLASEIAKLRFEYGHRITDRAVAEAFGASAH